MGDSLISRSEDGRTKIDAMLEGESLWLCRRQLAELVWQSQGNEKIADRHRL
jgi:hypothetical protein